MISLTAVGPLPDPTEATSGLRDSSSVILCVQWQCSCSVASFQSVKKHDISTFMAVCLMLSVLSGVGVGVNWFVVSGCVAHDACYSCSAKCDAQLGRLYDWVPASQSVPFRHLLCYLLCALASQRK